MAAPELRRPRAHGAEQRDRVRGAAPVALRHDDVDRADARERLRERREGVGVDAVVVRDEDVAQDTSTSRSSSSVARPASAPYAYCRIALRMPATGIARTTPQKPATFAPSRSEKNTKIGWMPMLFDMMRGLMTLSAICCSRTVVMNTQRSRSPAATAVTPSTGIIAMIGPKKGMMTVSPDTIARTPANGTPNSARYASVANP